MKNTILTTYKRERDSELTTTVTRIVEGMDNNPNFTDPPPELAEIKQLLPEYGIAVANAKGRDTVKVSIKKDKKAELVAKLTRLAAYVTLKCNGDRTMLLTSGFYISGEKGEASEPNIGKLEVELGPPGIITTRIKRVAGTRAYMHQYTTEAPSSATLWFSQGSAEAAHTFSGLTSGKTYWLRIVVLTNSGKMVYSSVETRIVQ